MEGSVKLGWANKAASRFLHCGARREKVTPASGRGLLQASFGMEPNQYPCGKVTLDRLGSVRQKAMLLALHEHYGKSLVY